MKHVRFSDLEPIVEVEETQWKSYVIFFPFVFVLSLETSDGKRLLAEITCTSDYYQVLQIIDMFCRLLTCGVDY